MRDTSCRCRFSMKAASKTDSSAARCCPIALEWRKIARQRCKIGYEISFTRHVVLEVFNGYMDDRKALIWGIGKRDRQGNLVRLESVEEIVALDPLDVPSRLCELRRLKNGWLDGEGVAPAPEFLDWLAGTFDRLYPDELPLPHIYPTVEGGVQAEWSLSSHEVSLSIDFAAAWIGRDLGHRGGRRTGLALTDDVHFHMHLKRWELSFKRPTKSPVVAEQTAEIVWRVLSQIELPVFLWNVFPLHPHKPDNPFSNRRHNSKERRIGEEFLAELILLLRPRRLIAIGNDAFHTTSRLCSRRDVFRVRHPSYGGQAQFLRDMQELYPR